MNKPRVIKILTEAKAFFTSKDKLVTNPYSTFERNDGLVLSRYENLKVLKECRACLLGAVNIAYRKLKASYINYRNAEDLLSDCLPKGKTFSSAFTLKEVRTIFDRAIKKAESL